MDGLEIDIEQFYKDADIERNINRSKKVWKDQIPTIASGLVTSFEDAFSSRTETITELDSSDGFRGRFGNTNFDVDNKLAYTTGRKYTFSTELETSVLQGVTEPVRLAVRKQFPEFDPEIKSKFDLSFFLKYYLHSGIWRKRILFDNVTISDTAELGDYLFRIELKLSNTNELYDKTEALNVDCPIIGFNPVFSRMDSSTFGIPNAGLINAVSTSIKNTILKEMPEQQRFFSDSMFGFLRDRKLIP